ncbi:MAG: YigZ family protein [Bacteroidota bacterium]
MDFYFTIEKPSVAEFKDRGSRFIAYAFSIETTNDFKEKLADIKKEHPKATHHCFAYRLGLDGNNFRVSDDGEPSGSAGRPILGQIDSKQLTNTLVIVVRYFGGTLLGVPGLVNAYKTVASLALQTTPVTQRSVQVHYTIHFDYTQLNNVMRIIKLYNCTITKQDIQLFCVISISIAKDQSDEVISRLTETGTVELVKN